jgi:hypothetical protein
MLLDKLVTEVKQFITAPDELNTMRPTHSIIQGDACFAYFNKIWGIPLQTDTR